jgi:hypothetical protein
MKTIIKLWLLVIWVIAVTSCSTTRQIKKCEKCFTLLDTTSSISIKDSVAIVYDTVDYVYTVNADTTIQYLLIECDTLGKASIKTSEKKKGIRSDLSLQLKDNRLVAVSTCDRVVDSLELVISNTQKFRSETTSNTVFVPKLVEAKLTWWQKIKIRFGGWAFLIIAIYIAYKGLKTYYKVNTPMGLLLTIRRKLLR